MPHSIPAVVAYWPWPVVLLLVEHPPDDQHRGPDPGRHDHRAIAARHVECLALGAHEQQHEHSYRHQEHGRLDERECSPAGQRDARRPQRGRLAARDHRLLIPRCKERQEQAECRGGGQPPFRRQDAPRPGDPAGQRGRLPEPVTRGGRSAHAPRSSEDPIGLQLRATQRLYVSPRARTDASALGPARTTLASDDRDVAASRRARRPRGGPSARCTSRSARGARAAARGAPRPAAAGARAGSGRGAARTASSRSSTIASDRERRERACRLGSCAIGRRRGSRGCHPAAVGLRMAAAAASAISRSAASEASVEPLLEPPQRRGGQSSRGAIAAGIGRSGGHRR